jgi:hypothetical protein
VKSVTLIIFTSIQFLSAKVGNIVFAPALVSVSYCVIGAAHHCHFLLVAGCK